MVPYYTKRASFRSPKTARTHRRLFLVKRVGLKHATNMTKKNSFAGQKNLGPESVLSSLAQGGKFVGRKGFCLDLTLKMILSF